MQNTFQATADVRGTTQGSKRPCGGAKTVAVDILCGQWVELQQGLAHFIAGLLIWDGCVCLYTTMTTVKRLYIAFDDLLRIAPSRGASYTIPSGQLSVSLESTS